MFRIFGYLKYYKKEAILGPLCKLIEAIFELIVPLVMANIIDIGIANGDKRYVFSHGLLMVLLGVSGLLFAIVCQYFASKASQGVGTRLRNDMFKHIGELSYTEIDKIGTPSLITRITNDINQVQVAVAMLIRLVVRAPFLIIGSIVLSMMIDIKLSLVFLIAAPLVAIALYFIMTRSSKLYRIIQKKLDKISLITRENLSGVRVIRAFSKQKDQEERFDNANDDFLKSSIRVGKISALLNPITSAIINFGIIAIIWFGGTQVDSGSLMQGHIIAFVNYMTQILLALIVVANLVILFTKSSASAARINEVFDLIPSIKQGSIDKITDINKSTPKIEFKDVTFCYSGSSEPSLSNISIKIYPGETIGIIGGTGSGKSTFVNLIPRFYDVTQGEVLVDGINVKAYKFKTLRNKIGMVPQKAVLFSGTIMDNMRWGKENATLDEIKRAINIAQASDFIENSPEKYDTLIMQAGKNLSGGQKQRLTIARALVSNPEILILDDSASALDYATDAALRQALKYNTKNMTVIMVSQRATSIKHANKIIVLDDGIAVGIGTHDELLKTCEIYRDICGWQSATPRRGGGEAPLQSG